MSEILNKCMTAHSYIYVCRIHRNPFRLGETILKRACMCVTKVENTCAWHATLLFFSFTQKKSLRKRNASSSSYSITYESDATKFNGLLNEGKAVPNYNKKMLNWKQKERVLSASVE